jgi:hypothetical protein
MKKNVPTRSRTVSRRALLVGAAASLAAPAPQAERYLFQLDSFRVLKRGLPRFRMACPLVEEPIFQMSDGNVRWHIRSARP